MPAAAAAQVNRAASCFVTRFIIDATPVPLMFTALMHLTSSASLRRACFGLGAACCLFFIPPAAGAETSLSLEENRQRVAAIDTELLTLPKPAGLPSTPRLGFQSHLTPSQKWVRMTFDAPRRADSLVLVPAVAPGASGYVTGFGLPRELDIEIESTEGREHFKHTPAHPGTIAPVIVRFTARDIKTIRITALVPWQSSAPAVLALAEIFVLDGAVNVAPFADVAGKEPFNSGDANGRIWDASNLIDLETPLGIPVKPGGERWKGYASSTGPHKETLKTIVLDFGQPRVIDEIRLVPAHLPEVPKWTDFGFPERFELQASDNADFTNATTIYNSYERYSGGPGRNVVIIHPRKIITARYLRLSASRVRERARDFLLALAEIQVLSRGQNIALGLQPQVTDTLDDPQWSPAALTDGQAPGGVLVDWPEWLRMLARRQELETERALLIAAQPALQEIEQRRRTTLLTFALVTLAVLAISTLIWRERRRRREERRLRERLARDLHDEIGSNLGSIALLTGFAQRNPSADERLRADLATIEQTARESASSMRDMVRLLQLRPGIAGGHWLDVLRALTQRLLPDHEVIIQFDEGLPEPGIDIRRELYLLCKEAFHNIARHARAQKVTFAMSRTPGGLQILIRDDGRGFDLTREDHGNGIGNMRERAAQMHATLDIDSTPQGTTLTLHASL
jgi:signal transduction histidine kinase